MVHFSIFVINKPICPNCGKKLYEEISFLRDDKLDPEDWQTLHWWRCICGYKRERPANPRLDPTVTITKIQ